MADYASWQGDLDIAIAGTALHSSEDYVQAAAGAYDARWRTAARHIQAARGYSQGVTYVRPWHEFNGDWYWQVTASNVEQYKAAFRRYVGILRAECPNCVIVWSPNDGSSPGSAPIAAAYPGDDVVDVIGVDSYNANGNPVVTDDASWSRYANQLEEDGSPHGVETWRRFAEQHGKPVGFPEWGLNPKGGGDYPEYIRRMNAWMSEHAAGPGETNLAGKVIYDVYFNVEHEGNPGFLIKDGPNPTAGETYQSLRWGAQASYTTTTATTTPTASSSTAPPTSSAQVPSSTTQTPSSSATSAPASPSTVDLGSITLGAPGVTGTEQEIHNQPYVPGSTGVAQQLDLYLPKRTGTAIPLVVFIHGGAFSSGDKTDVSTFSQAFLSRGFAVASVNYRLSGDAPFPAGAQDVKAAIRWLRANAAQYGIDPGRVGAFGTSAGGYMASILGVTVSQQPSALDDPTLGNADVSSAVQAVASLYGPTDFASMNAQAKQCSGTPQDHDAANSPESVWLRSPVQTSNLASAANLTKWIPAAKPGSIPPFLLIHGTADCSVPSGQSEELATALRPTGVRVDVDLVSGAGHADTAIDQGRLPQIVAFFDRELAGRNQSSSAATSAAQASQSSQPPAVNSSGSTHA